MQIFSRLDYNSREAKWRRRDVIILECLQHPRPRLFFGEYRIRRVKYLVERVRPHELLHHRDVGMVRLIERKTLWKRLAQTRVVGHRMLNHRGVRLKRDVDRRHRVLLRDGSSDTSG